MTLFYAAARLLLFAFFGAAHLDGDHGVATRFGDPGDLLAGPHLSCTHQKLQPGQLVCAHRTLPCGTVVLLENVRTGRFGVCQVLDRGPFGALLPSGERVVKIRPSEPGAWRGLIDLAPSVAESLALNGREPVRVFYQQVARHLRFGRELPRRAAGTERR